MNKEQQLAAERIAGNMTLGATYITRGEETDKVTPEDSKGEPNG